MDIKLYNQDCFDFLKNVPSNSIDLVLIDPPYEISRTTNFSIGSDKKAYSFKYKNLSMDFGDWDKNFSGLDIVIKESYRVLRKGGTFISFYDLWKITTISDLMKDSKFVQLRLIEWLKTNPVPVNSKINYLSSAREIAVLGIKGSKPTFNSSYDNGLYSFPICHDKGRFHPTQKPLVLIQELIKKHSNEGDTVLDCFAGSATTAIACAFLNRNFIGCEIDKEYYEKSIKRINENTN